MKWKWKSMRRGGGMLSCTGKIACRGLDAGQRRGAIPAFTGISFAHRQIRASRRCPPCAAKPASPQPEQALRIAIADFLPVGVCEIERTDHLGRIADVAWALFLVEWAVGGEQHVIGR